MTARILPAKDKLTICFAHVAYRMGERFALRNTGLKSFEVRNRDELEQRIGEADVLLVSGLWRNELIAKAPRLAFIQSISAGLDQYSRDALDAAGIRLASAQGANERAVAEHAIALILAMARQLPQARDNQAARKWRGMISDIAKREDELGGKTLVIVGMGRIGSRLAALAKAFDMRVIGTKRDPSRGNGAPDAVVAQDRMLEVLPEADFVALTCPLTPATEKLMDARALAAMKPSAYLVNVARGRVVDEPALIDALANGTIAGAAVDCACEEPLPEGSPLWSAKNIFITPHTAGETRRYEDNVIDLLLENLARLWRGEAELKNGVV
jgi:D-2-hydroxyacid dehydrogenase (NADP+)